MTYGTRFLFAVCLAAFTFLAGASHASGADGPIELVSGGESGYAIAVAQEASDAEVHAAKELQQYIDKMSGCTLPIVRDPDDSQVGPFICIGMSRIAARLKPDFDIAALKEEGIAIKTVGPNMLVLGSRTRGALYATYTFLEQLGVRFYSADVERVPKRSTITVSPTDMTHQPSFLYRLTTYPESLDPRFSVKLKINMNPFGLDRVGGGYRPSRHMTHTFYSLVPPQKYFDDHPEYFALVDGERQRAFSQLCLTNPGTIRVATETVLRWIEEEPEAYSFGVVQNDWLKNCECEPCKAIDDREGTPAGSLVYFCNEIAKAVAEKYPGVGLDGRPEKTIHTIAYTYTEKPPKALKPAPNVVVTLCHMYPSCDSHPIETCPKDARYFEHLKGWLALTENVMVWHYLVDFTHFSLPFPNFNAIRADLPMYARSGVQGFLGQAVPPGAGKEMSELRNYVCAKLAWNIDEDVDALIDDFMDGFFGPAAGPMREYFNLIHKEVEDAGCHMHLYSGLEAGYLTDEVMTRIGELFDEAEVAVADDPAFLKRVRKERMGEWYARLIAHPGFVTKEGYIEAVDREQREVWLKSYLETASANGITRHCEDLPMRVFETRQRFLTEKHDIVLMAELAPSIMQIMEEAMSAAREITHPIDGRPHYDVYDMKQSAPRRRFGSSGMTVLEHYWTEYGVSQYSTTDIWQRYLSEEKFKELLSPRLVD